MFFGKNRKKNLRNLLIYYVIAHICMENCSKNVLITKWNTKCPQNKENNSNSIRKILRSNKKNVAFKTIAKNQDFNI